jgi:two-component system, OmpR family, response regulator
VRLLIVDDDVLLCDVLRRGLAEQGHVIDLAHDGEEGELCAAGGQYDAAIVDVNLPKRDGLSVIRSLRACGKQTPVLVLTSDDTVSDVVEGLDAGADDYLCKPFVFDVLRARLRAIARRGGAPIASDELFVNDLGFDTVRRKVHRRGREIALTRREMAFLEYLMRNAHRVVTRRMLEDAMFDRESDVASNVVDVYISRLRAKITAGGEKQLLHTVRGVGYLLGDR